MQFDQLRRREFITLLGGAAAAWPLAARAQQPSMPVIGWLSARSPETDGLLLPAFRYGLSTQGYVEGRNVAIEYRWGNGRLVGLVPDAADFIRRRVAVIVAPGTGGEAMQAAQTAGSTIPIVFVVGSDPIERGLVPNLNRPGGNLTGVTAFQRQLAPKRLDILDRLLPGSSMIAVLENPTNSFLETPDLQVAARALGKQVRTLNASMEHEIDAAFASLSQMRADALIVATNPLFLTRANQIVALAARVSVPALYYRREFAAAGGLMSYGSTTQEVYRVLGEYTGRILKGENPAEMPVVQPTKFELVINLKTARALGLVVPPTLLALADEVME